MLVVFSEAFHSVRRRTDLQLAWRTLGQIRSAQMQFRCIRCSLMLNFSIHESIRPKKREIEVWVSSQKADVFL